MIRFAIWAAVSREEQARPDKISLQDQEARCRAIATSKGWQETAGPYIVPGESRTIYVDLSAAEQAIPELRWMFNDAQRGRFDVLIMYDYNRLRELIDPVARVLANYRVQLYSTVQSVEPIAPEHYSPYQADSAWIMQGVSQIISRSQISDLRRKYQIGMPARVRDRGLPAISIPFGYRKPPGHEKDSAAIPEQDPITAPVVLKLKDLLLAGRSLPQLVKFATGTGIHPPNHGKQWYAATIREILRNPFYAGYNRWGLSNTHTDLRTGKRIRNRHLDPKEMIVEKGHHTPLWDDDTHTAILAELERRGRSYRGKSLTQLSKLLKCAACQSTLWMQHNGSRLEPDRSIWRCSNKDCGKANIHHTQALEQLAIKLRQELHKTPDPGLPPSTEPTTGELEQKKLDELYKRRDRIVDIYQEGGLTKEEYMRRRYELDIQIYTAEDELAAAITKRSAHAERARIRNDFANLVDYVPNWLTTSAPQETNRALHLLLEYIWVQHDQITEIKFRD